jgi:hypothetical protein
MRGKGNPIISADFYDAILADYGLIEASAILKFD